MRRILAVLVGLALMVPAPVSVAVASEDLPVVAGSTELLAAESGEIDVVVPESGLYMRPGDVPDDVEWDLVGIDWAIISLVSFERTDGVPRQLLSYFVARREVCDDLTGCPEYLEHELIVRGPGSGTEPVPLHGRYRLTVHVPRGGYLRAGMEFVGLDGSVALRPTRGVATEAEVDAVRGRGEVNWRVGHEMQVPAESFQMTVRHERTFRDVQLYVVDGKILYDLCVTPPGQAERCVGGGGRTEIRGGGNAYALTHYVTGQFSWEPGLWFSRYVRNARAQSYAFWFVDINLPFPPAD